MNRSDPREAWRQLRKAWARTTERVGPMAEGSEDLGVDGECDLDKLSRRGAP
jgi:hypothetical protein